MSMSSLLKKYIKMVLETVEKDQSVGTNIEEETDDIVEFSGAGACAGFTAPLGASSEDLQPAPTMRKVRKR